MKSNRLLVIAACTAAGLAASAIAADNPFAAFKGKVKPGLYDYKMEMDMGNMPGMPPGMGKQTMNMQNCVTPEQIERGGWDNPKDRQRTDCEYRNFKMSGNSATYTMECKKPAMKADVAMVFGNDSFKMDMQMNMDHQGQPMKMNQKMEAKYVGPCTK
jgi:hypothetical protein